MVIAVPTPRCRMFRARFAMVLAPLVLLSCHEPAEQDAGKSGVKGRLAWVDARIDSEFPDLHDLYLHLHQNPELSLQEEKTAARMAEELKKLGFDVTAKIGGHGVV